MIPAPPEHVERIVFLGTPALAVAPLRALVDAGYEVPLVVSRADTRRGRGGRSVPSPVKAAALELGLTVTDDLDAVCDTDADLGVVVAYGRIIPVPILERLAMVNLHFSLLPRWRGAAPVERAILAGDPRTGSCLMAVEEGLDTGGVYRRDAVDIDPDETLDELRGRLVEIGTAQLLDALAHGFGPAEAQQGEPVYAAKIDPAERRLRWDEQAEMLHRRVRVGGAWTTWRDDRLKIHRSRLEDPDAPPAATPGTLDGLDVICGRGRLGLVEVQAAGRTRQDAAVWRNGAQPRPGERLV